jgi:KaiC/GvpD/RAD55 family RecA-like ATPase/5S rRNA maturation endonuclease (ribonuclease M5)
MGISNAWLAAHPGEILSRFTDWRQALASLMRCAPWEAAFMTETAQAAARRLAATPLADGFLPAGLHEYTDRAGNILFHRIRLKHPSFATLPDEVRAKYQGKDKWIRPMYLNGNGYELGEPQFPKGKKPLYNLHALAGDATVWVVEGEQKADALKRLGLNATTSGGASSADKTDWTPLRNRTVIIWPDYDEPGKAYAGHVAQVLLELGCQVSCVDVDKLALSRGQDAIDWLAVHEHATAGDIESLPVVEAKSPATMPQLDRKPRFPRAWIDDVELEFTNDDWIKGVIGKKSLILVYGPSGDGKTFFAIDLAAHLACGQAWRGRRVRKGLVVYVAAEAGASILRRFVAWRDKHLSEACEERTPLAIITRGANLLNAIDVEALILELRAISDEAGLPVAVVCFDTLSRSTPGGDENAAADITRAIAAGDQLRDELGATAIYIHHTGKDAAKGARGHSSLFAAADTVISVVERVATIEKSRDGIQGESFAFELEVVHFGQDDDGDPITTCIVTPTEAQEPAVKAPRLSPDERIALDALVHEISVSGELLSRTSVIPGGVRGVRGEAWRNRFYGLLGETRDLESQTARKQAWYRGKKGLIAKGLAGCWDEFAWIVKA